MKKALKILGIVLGCVLLLIGIVLAYFSIKGVPSYETQSLDITVNVDSATVARGTYLAHLTCVHCHKGEDGKLSGQFLEDGAFGKLISPNITQDEEAGIGSYSDGELAFLLRTGIRKDGKFTLPIMPQFPNLSDADLNALIAFLRSEDPLVQPSDAVQDESEPSLLAKILLNVAIKPLPVPENTITKPPVSDQVAYGKYVATGVVQCYHCHSESFSTIDDLVPENTPGFFGGGNVVADPTNMEVTLPTPNLTPHPEYGIGGWTKEEFANAVRFGQGKDGVALSPAMPTFSSMSEEDAYAMFEYLKTIPPLANEVATTASQ